VLKVGFAGIVFTTPKIKASSMQQPCIIGTIHLTESHQINQE
jgi:hypothetical protein